MNRRRLLVALGGLAGTAGALGTGAFTSVAASRDVSVAVADDSDALLALGPCDGPNGDYVTETGGTVALDLSPSNGNVAGNGVNAEATVVVDDAFQIENQGTQPVGVWLDVDPVEDASGTDRVQFYLDGDRSTEIVGRSNARCLDVGESLCVGLSVDTHGVGSTTDLLNDDEMVVHGDASVGCSAGSVPGVDAGPLAYYPLDGDATDATGNGFDGTVQGATFTANSRVGAQAAAFDGSASYVEVPDDPALDVTGPYTETAWVNLDDTSGRHDVVSKFDVDADFEDSHWALTVQVRDGQLRAGFEDAADVDYIGVGGSVPASTWTHLAVVYDGSSVAGYVDGSEVFSVAQATGDGSGSVADATPPTNDEPLRIGRGEDYFDGRIDDLRIYDRALTASEVASLAGSA
jgi:hypothetical protein